MPCLFCNSEHRKSKLEFRWPPLASGVLYTRPAEYCKEFGWMVNLDPPIPEVGVGTLVLGFVQTKDVAEVVPDAKAEPQIWENS